MSDIHAPTPSFKARGSLSIFARSRRRFSSSGDRRPRWSGGRSPSIPTSRGSCWPTWSSSGSTPDAEALRPVVEAVITRYPCRAIVVRGSDDPERRITAEVSALCHLPDPGLPQVCSERIRAPRRPECGGPRGRRGAALARGRPAAGALVDHRSAVERGPRSVTWAMSARGSCSIFPIRGPRPPPCGLGLDPAICPCSRDTAWFGLTRWRELVAQFFDPSLPSRDAQPDRLAPDRGPLSRSQQAPAPGDLAGCLAGGTARLETARAAGQPGHLVGQLVPRGVPRSPGNPRRGDRHPGGSSQRCRRRQAWSASRSRRAGPEGVETFCLSRPSPDSPDVRIAAKAPDYCRLPSMVRAPELDPARRVAAALDASRFDRPFENARPIALWLLEHA